MENVKKYSMYAQIINTILGIIIMTLPGVYGFDKVVANIYHILGPLIVMIAFTAIFECTRNLRWINVLLGLMLIFSPLVTGKEFPDLHSLIPGGFVFVFSLVKGRMKHRFSNGWKELFQ